MSISTAALPSLARRPASVLNDLVWRLTIDQYHAMTRGGILTDDDPVELLEGWLVLKMTKSPRHSTVRWLLLKALERLVPAGWYVDPSGQPHMLRYWDGDQWTKHTAQR